MLRITLFLAAALAGQVEPMSEAIFQLRTEGIKSIPADVLKEIGIANAAQAKLPPVDPHGGLEEVAGKYAGALKRQAKKEARDVRVKAREPKKDNLTAEERKQKELDDKEAQEDAEFAQDDAEVLSATEPTMRYAATGAKKVHEIVVKGAFPDANAAMAEMRKWEVTREVEEDAAAAPATPTATPPQQKKVKKQVRDLNNLKALLSEDTISFGVGYQVDNSVSPPVHYWVLALSPTPNVSTFKCNCGADGEPTAETSSNADNNAQQNQQ